MQTNANKLIDDLDEEIMRVKIMINTSGYNHYSAFDSIVRDYRNKLKELRKLVREDELEEHITDYSGDKI